MLVNKKVGLKWEGVVIALSKKYLQFRKIEKFPNLKEFFFTAILGIMVGPLRRM